MEGLVVGTDIKCVMGRAKLALGYVIGSQIYWLKLRLSGSYDVLKA